MNKIILVTGGAGYIGSHTAYLLVQCGYEVIILDSFLHNQRFAPSWATVIKSDFADEEVLARLFTMHSIDAVIHCAASIEVGESVASPRQFYENNVTKTLKLLDLMLQYQVKRFIFSSSGAVYENPVVLPITEEHRLNPASPYGKTKLVVEHALADYAAAYDFSYVSLRYFNAAGAYPEAGLGEQHHPETHLIPSLFSCLKQRTVCTVHGADYDTKDGTCVRDYIHVRDIADAHVRALEHLEKTGACEIFNIGAGIGYSVKEVIAAVEKTCGAHVTIQVGGRRTGDPSTLVADPTKARLILGWEPHYSDLDFIVKSALRWDDLLD